MMLEVRDLYTSYDLSQVLFGVSLEVGHGQADVAPRLPGPAAEVLQ